MVAPLLIGVARVKKVKNAAAANAAKKELYDPAQQLYETQFDQNYSGIRNTQVIRSEKEDVEKQKKKRQGKKKSFIDRTAPTNVAQSIMTNSPELAGQVRRRGKAARLAARAGWFWAVPFGVQFVGAIISFTGFAGLASADAIPLLGDFIIGITNIDGLVVLGGLIAIVGGMIGYIALTLIFLISRVNIFTWPILLSFAVTLGLHTIPVVNFLPLVVIWMVHIMIDPLLGLKKAMKE